jgi:hypothetical protein
MITQIKQAFALSPRDPLSGVWYLYLGYAEFCRDWIDAAIEQLTPFWPEPRPRKGTTPRQNAL